jgi:hypothetical protein
VLAKKIPSSNAKKQTQLTSAQRPPNSHQHSGHPAQLIDVDSIKLLFEEGMIHGGRVRVVTVRRIVQESAVYFTELQERYYAQNFNG